MRSSAPAPTVSNEVVTEIDLRDRPMSNDAFASELDRLLKDALAKALDLPLDDPYPNRGPGRVRR